MYTQPKNRAGMTIPINYGGTSLLTEDQYIAPAEEEETKKEEPVRVPPPPAHPTVSEKKTAPREIPVFGPPPSEKDGIAFGITSAINLLKLSKLKLPFLGNRDPSEQKPRDICDILLPALALLLLFCKKPDRLGALMLLVLLLIK